MCLYCTRIFIYVFSWSFRNGVNHAHFTQLMVYNEEVGPIHLRLDVQGSITGNGIAVIHVIKGDDVFVRIAGGSGVKKNNDPRRIMTGGHFST